MTGLRPVEQAADPRLVNDALAGLWDEPPSLRPRWFYDERGSLLFDEITRLPEYYPSRREREILGVRSVDIAAWTHADTLIELGSGTSAKTRLLLHALTQSGRAVEFAPLDVSAEVLLESARAVETEYPTVTVTPVIADFGDALGPFPGEPGHRLVAFLGSTIGNFGPPERNAFLQRVRAVLAPGDHFLLGADLIKDPARLIAAYDDSAGVTAAFNRNLIEVLRRELGGEGVSADDFEHVVRWNTEQSRIEMWLLARRDVRARFAGLGREWSLSAGQEMLTEISTKFRVPRLRAELFRAGFRPRRTWLDAKGDYSLTMAIAV